MIDYVCILRGNKVKYQGLQFTCCELVIIYAKIVCGAVNLY